MLTLSFVEKESDSNTIELTQHSLHNPIKNTISLCEAKAKSKNINLKLIGEDTLIPLNIPLFEQAMINLVDNAIKYSQDGSRVIIETNYDQNFAYISVIDQGTGIPKEHHERLFERFYSVDKARSRELGGSGLGLSIVKHIINAHKGFITLESYPNKGTTFITKLPLL